MLAEFNVPLLRTVPPTVPAPPMAVAAVCERCWSALFCEDGLAMLDDPDWNKFFNSAATCCGSAFFVLNTTTAWSRSDGFSTPRFNESPWPDSVPLLTTVSSEKVFSPFNVSPMFPIAVGGLKLSSNEPKLSLAVALEGAGDAFGAGGLTERVLATGRRAAGASPNADNLSTSLSPTPFR